MLVLYFNFVLCSESEDWPSPRDLVDNGTRVVLAGLEPSRLVFSTVTDAPEVSELTSLVGPLPKIKAVKSCMN